MLGPRVLQQPSPADQSGLDIEAGLVNEYCTSPPPRRLRISPDEALVSRTDEQVDVPIADEFGVGGTAAKLDEQSVNLPILLGRNGQARKGRAASKPKLDVPSTDVPDAGEMAMNAEDASATFPNTLASIDHTTSVQASQPLPIDPSLLFGMERTLYSAVNVGALTTTFGFGLMMVSMDLHHAQGCAISTAGLIFVLCSWLTHCARLRALSRGRTPTMHSSIAWTGFLVCLLCVCISLELYYSVKFPYLERSMPVDVNGPIPGMRASTTRPP